MPKVSFDEKSKKNVFEKLTDRLFSWPFAAVFIIIVIIIFILLGLSQCSPSQYQIDFVTNGGTMVEPLVKAKGAKIEAPISTKVGHTLLSWHQSETLEDEAFVFEKMPGSNLTLYANWSINQYTITYVTSGGTAIAPYTADYKTAITAPTDPTRIEGAFQGWYTNVGLTDQFNFPSTMPAYDLTLYAKWTMNQYTISFETNGGDILNALNVDYGATISLPTPTKTGHSFAGWYSDAALTSPFSQTVMTNESITVYAKWTINQYTLTFVTNGGNEIAPITADFDTLYTKPADPTKANHTFGGWYIDANLTTPATLPDRIPGENLTFYAKWEAVQYKISFVGYGEINVKRVYNGAWHTFFLTEEGVAYGTGNNPKGQLGIGVEGQSIFVPTPVITSNFLPNESIVEISAHYGDNSYFLTNLGRVFGTGSNTAYQIGDGTNTSRLIPTLINTSNFQEGEVVTQLAGAMGGLVITNQHRIYGWGLNTYGQVGTGTTTNVSIPTLITLPDLHEGEFPTQVASSGHHSLALTSEGRLFVWGRSTKGQLGLNDNVNRALPTLWTRNIPIPNFSGIKKIVARMENSLVLTESGAIFVWGENGRGQVGDSTTISRNNPTEVSTLVLYPSIEGEKIIDIGGGVSHTIAYTNHHRIIGWGPNDASTANILGFEFGDVFNSPRMITLPNFPAGESISYVSGTGNGSFIGLSDGSLYVAGSGDIGQFGDASIAALPRYGFKNYRPKSQVKLLDDVLVAYNSPLSLPTPTLNGKTFQGWYMDAAFTTPMTFATMPDHDLTLYAKWS